jgi:hypothetical protein
MTPRRVGLRLSWAAPMAAVIVVGPALFAIYGDPAGGSENAPGALVTGLPPVAGASRHATTRAVCPKP